MYQSTTPSLLQTIWARWTSRQFLSLPIVETLLPVTFGYSLSSEAVVVMRQLRKWKRLWRRSLTHSHKRTSMGPSRSCCNGRTGAFEPEEITSKGLEFYVCTINKSAHTKKVWKLIVCTYIFFSWTHSFLSFFNLSKWSVRSWLGWELFNTLSYILLSQTTSFLMLVNYLHSKELKLGELKSSQAN